MASSVLRVLGGGGSTGTPGFTELSDGFDGADSDPIDSPWAPLATDGVTTNLGRRGGARVSNKFTATTNPPVATSGTLSASYHTTALSTDDMEAGAVFAASPDGVVQNNYSSQVVFRAAPGQADVYVGGVALLGTGGSGTAGPYQPALLRHSAGADTTLGTAPTARAVPLGSHIKVRAVGSVLRQYINGIQTYTVTDAVHPRGAGYRHCGLRTTALRSTTGGAVTYSPGWDDWWARDINPNRAVESQGVYLNTATSLATGTTWRTIGLSSAIPTAANGMLGKAPYVKETRFETDSLVVTGKGTVNITARVQLTATSAGFQVQVLKNGVSIAASVAANSTVATITASNVSVVEGDTITFQARQTSGLSRTMSAGSTVTYLEMVNASVPVVVPITLGDNFGTYTGPQMAVRMSKTGTTPRFGISNNWADLTGWSPVNDNHYNGSAVDSDVALVAPANWDNALITAHVPFVSGGTAGGVAQIRIVRISDGAIIATGPTFTSVSTTSYGAAGKVYCNVTGQNVVAGEKYKIQARWSLASTAPYAQVNNVAAGSSGAYLAIEQQVVETLSPSIWDIWSYDGGTGQINIVNGNANGEIVTPSTPLTYATAKTKLDSGDQRIFGKLAGQVDAYHSTVSMVGRANDAHTVWAEFAVCKTLVAIYARYNGIFNYLTDIRTQSILDMVVWGAELELRIIGTLFQGYINGTLVTSTTITDANVPAANRNVGFMLQDDSREPGVSDTYDVGGPTPRLSKWWAAAA